MGIPIFQVDAFTDRPFAGNPAAVCLLPAPAEAGWMQALAREMNLSETAFLVPEEEGFGLRWFTPAMEVDLCGHATLASAHVLWESGTAAPGRTLAFHTRSGRLTAEPAEGGVALDFPASPVEPVAAPAGLLAALGAEARFVGRTPFDYLVEVADATAVRRLAPDFAALRDLGVRGVIVTSRADGGEDDIVSRFFAPGAGIDEDPVTGSAHCALGPYWAARLGRDTLAAYQASARGGRLRVTVLGERVRLVGSAVTVFRGELAAGAAA